MTRIVLRHVFQTAEFRSGILEKRAYGRIPPRLLADILWALELASRTPKTEATARPMVWVEHVMPVSWEEHWPLLDEGGDPIGDEDSRYWKRQTDIHTLGNLTIVTESLNRSLSHRPFNEKKIQLEEHSNLSLNRRIAENQVWDESSIARHGEALASLSPAPYGLWRKSSR